MTKKTERISITFAQRRQVYALVEKMRDKNEFRDMFADEGVTAVQSKLSFPVGHMTVRRAMQDSGVKWHKRNPRTDKPKQLSPDVQALQAEVKKLREDVNALVEIVLSDASKQEKAVTVRRLSIAESPAA